MSILAKVNPTTTVGTVIYTAPAGRKPLVNVNIANVSLVDASFTLGLVQNQDQSLVSVAVTAGGEYATIPLVEVTGANTSAAAVEVVTLAAVGVTVTAAGTGFAVGNVLTVAAGTSTAKATLTVTAVAANGVILTATLTTGGVYTVLPAGASTVTGGAGKLATFTLTWKLLTVAVTAAGNGYSRLSTAFTTTGGGVVTQAELTPQFTTVFEATTDSYHPVTALSASGVIERTGITLSAGDSIVAVSSVPGAINFIVLGYEDLA